MKKIVSFVLAAMMALAMTACGSAADEGFDAAKEIAVNSREDGSGTRGAFIELFGIEKKNEAGEKVDYTTLEAATNNSTSVMMTAVANNPYAIGYISMGSLDDSVKALKIDGVEASVENIKNGTYGASRPFNIAVKAEISELAQDFIDFILSAEGQAVIEDKGYISVAAGASFAGTLPEGKITVAGSSSVTPVMEKLKEAYEALNTGAEIVILQSDSTSGMTSAIDGSCDIGMASRAVKDSELGAGLKEITIAIDGIAVIVNKENPLEDLTTEQVMNIYIGETTLWSDVIR